MPGCWDAGMLDDAPPSQAHVCLPRQVGTLILIAGSEQRWSVVRGNKNHARLISYNPPAVRPCRNAAAQSHRLPLECC